MGANSSKPDGPSQHVFTAENPTRVSPAFVGSLEDTTQSDNTRASNQELKIQTRVTAELEKLALKEGQNLQAAISSATSEPPAESEPSLVDRMTGAAEEQQRRAGLSRDSVAREIDKMKKKLDGRKKLEKADSMVEKAKEELVQCLRANDRRPLDCWRETEAFKREVRRLQGEFVERTTR